MEHITKPDLADYRLNDYKYRRLKVFFPRIERILTVVIPFFIWTLIFIESLIIGHNTVWIGIIGGAIITIICSKLFGFIFHNLPIYKRVRAYEADFRVYSQRKAINDKGKRERELNRKRQR